MLATLRMVEESDFYVLLTWHYVCFIIIYFRVNVTLFNNKGRRKSVEFQDDGEFKLMVSIFRLIVQKEIS